MLILGPACRQTNLCTGINPHKHRMCKEITRNMHSTYLSYSRIKQSNNDSMGNNGIMCNKCGKYNLCSNVQQVTQFQPVQYVQSCNSRDTIGTWANSVAFTLPCVARYAARQAWLVEASIGRSSFNPLWWTDSLSKYSRTQDPSLDIIPVTRILRCGLDVPETFNVYRI